jgi:hypothetical protein
MVINIWPLPSGITEKQHVREQKEPDLANNNLAPAQVSILKALPPRRPPQSESCKEQHPGQQAALADDG